MAKAHKLQIETKNEHLWITLPDLIDMDNYLQIRNRIEAILTDKENKVVIDLSNSESINSLLIGLILHSRKIVKQNCGVFYLVNVSENCIIKFQALFLDKIVQIYGDENEFIADINN